MASSPWEDKKPIKKASGKGYEVFLCPLILYHCSLKIPLQLKDEVSVSLGNTWHDGIIGAKHDDGSYTVVLHKKPNEIVTQDRPIVVVPSSQIKKKSKTTKK